MKSDVYFIPCNLEDGEKEVVKKFESLLRAGGLFKNVEKGDFVPIKTHLGEKGNIGHVTPPFISAIGKIIKKLGGKPFVCETSTLYVGQRSNAIDHLTLAYNHGFTPGKIGMPIIMADGLSGHSQVPVEINGIHHKKVFISADVPQYDFLVTVSHVTGHLCSGMGATMKNIGMGLASRAGKLVQHSDITPEISKNLCTLCKACFKWCPENAISEVEGKAHIDKEKCIGCGECLAVCKDNAVVFSWNQESKILQEKMAEHAMAVIQDKMDKCVFINFAVKITKNCDCMAKDDPRVCDDIGILMSKDPIALEMATMDLVRKQSDTNLFENLHPNIDPLIQIRHGEKLKMGTSEYNLVEV